MTIADVCLGWQMNGLVRSAMTSMSAEIDSMSGGFARVLCANSPHPHIPLEWYRHSPAFAGDLLPGSISVLTPSAPNG